MKIEEQVTTVEQSKRLLELGVPANWASMVWRPVRSWNEEYREFQLELATI